MNGEVLYRKTRDKVWAAGKCVHNQSLPICQTTLFWVAKFDKSKSNLYFKGICVVCKKHFNMETPS